MLQNASRHVRKRAIERKRRREGKLVRFIGSPQMIASMMNRVTHRENSRRGLKQRTHVYFCNSRLFFMAP